MGLKLDTTGVPEGVYLLTASVESNGGYEEVFSEYLLVKLYDLYLPLVLKNH